MALSLPRPDRRFGDRTGVHVGAEPCSILQHRPCGPESSAQRDLGDDGRFGLSPGRGPGSRRVPPGRSPGLEHRPDRCWLYRTRHPGRSISRTSSGSRISGRCSGSTHRRDDDLPRDARTDPVLYVDTSTPNAYIHAISLADQSSDHHTDADTRALRDPNAQPHADAPSNVDIPAYLNPATHSHPAPALRSGCASAVVPACSGETSDRDRRPDRRGCRRPWKRDLDHVEWWC